MTGVQKHTLIWTASKRFTVVFENNTATCFLYTTIVPGQPTSLSKEACLYAGADWLSLCVSQRVAKSNLYGWKLFSIYVQWNSSFKPPTNLNSLISPAESGLEKTGPPVLVHLPGNVKGNITLAYMFDSVRQMWQKWLPSLLQFPLLTKPWDLGWWTLKKWAFLCIWIPQSFASALGSGTNTLRFFHSE